MNSDLPLVSVVLCTFNQREYLDDAVRSVLEQTYPRTELVAIDNGSSDGSAGILRGYADRPMVRTLLFEENAAVSARLNAGIAAATGSYISLLYGDDFYLPTKVERQINAFRSLPDEYGVVYSPGYRLDARTGARWLDPTPAISGDVLTGLLSAITEGFMNPISPLMRREVFERYPFDEELFVEGESIFLRIALTYRFFYLAEPLVVMREHDRNIGKATRRNTEGLMHTLEKLERRVDLPPAARTMLAGVRARVMRNVAWHAIRSAADRQWARECIALAARYESQQLLHPRALATLGLSVLPVPVIRALNARADRWRRARRHAAALAASRLT